MGDRVGAVRHELPPENGNPWQALADFIAEFTYANTTEVVRTANDAKAAKVVKVGDKENSTPT